VEIKIQAPWWKGRRGEWLVVAQVVLFVVIFLGPRTVFGRPHWTFPLPQFFTIIGVVFMVSGLLLSGAGVLRLGRRLTPLPYPQEGAPLIQTGPYALVRHPIYSGGLFLALGWALFIRGWLTLVYVAALFVLLDIKSRREEAWLAKKFPTYVDYQWRVRKLIPFIY
jgi:protein-S-isoprenylcysteine O-methyltransferase Ste14